MLACVRLMVDALRDIMMAQKLRGDLKHESQHNQVHVRLGTGGRGLGVRYLCVHVSSGSGSVMFEH